MAASGPWQILEHDRLDLPRLVARAGFDESGITLQVSDLNDIWIEHLDRKAVDARATKVDCVIDPRGDEGQYRILGGHLMSIVSKNAGTTIELATGIDDILVLRLQKILTAPLKALEWEARLAKSPSPLVKQEFVQPLIEEILQLRRQQDLLFKELAAKDHVITRTLDRLELSQTHLDQIFPQLANVRGFSRHDADRKTLAQHVRGLGSFDGKAWRSQQEQRRDRSDTDGVAQVLQSLPIVSDNGKVSSAQANWWQDVDLRLEQPQDDSTAVEGIDDTTVLPSTPVSQASQRRAARRRSDKSTSDEDDFTTMRSQTPQHEHPAPSVEAKTPPHRPERSSDARKLGAIGGNKKKQESVPTPELESTSHAPSRAAPGSKLGAIGGKKVQPEREPTPEPEAKPAPAKAKKAFTIGGKKATSGQVSDAAVPPAEPPHEEAPASTATSVADEDEAPEARANRKREQMKRQLEASSKAAAKKKRKF